MEEKQQLEIPIYEDYLDIPTIKATPIKVRCIKTYKPTEHRFKKGDLMELISVLYAGNLIEHERPRYNEETEKYDLVWPERIVEYYGTYKSSFLRTESGDEIPTSLIHWDLPQYLTKDIDAPIPDDNKNLD
jgi:hypothetical protein